MSFATDILKADQKAGIDMEWVAIEGGRSGKFILVAPVETRPVNSRMQSPMMFLGGVRIGQKRDSTQVHLFSLLTTTLP